MGSSLRLSAAPERPERSLSKALTSKKGGEAERKHAGARLNTRPVVKWRGKARKKSESENSGAGRTKKMKREEGRIGCQVNLDE